MKSHFPKKKLPSKFTRAPGNSTALVCTFPGGPCEVDSPLLQKTSQQPNVVHSFPCIPGNFIHFDGNFIHFHENFIHFYGNFINFDVNFIHFHENFIHFHENFVNPAARQRAPRPCVSPQGSITELVSTTSLW